MGEVMLVVALLIFVGTLCLVVVQTIRNMRDDTACLKGAVCHEDKKNKLITRIIWCLYAGCFSSITLASSEYQLTLPEFEQWYHSPEKEQALAWELRDGFLRLQTLLAEQSADQQKRRASHAKGHCVTGTFQVLADNELSPAATASKARLRHGLFAPAYVGQTLSARYRLSNASAEVLPDFMPDIRALSIAVRTDGGLAQHFAFNNTPRFQLQDLQVLADALKMGIMLAEGSYPLVAFTKLMLQSGPGRAFAVKAAIDMAEEDKAVADSFASQSYWSGSVFALGGHPVKLGTYPCRLTVQHTDDLVNETIAADEARQRGTDYLGTQLADTMQAGGMCQRLFVQFLDETDQYRNGSDSSLIEDNTRIWTGPVHTVAELQTGGEQLAPVVCDDPAHGLSPAQVHIDLPGLGQINRVRSLAESASWAAR